MSRYTSTFESEDEVIKDSTRSEVEKERKQKLEDYRQYRKRKELEHNQERELRKQLRDGAMTDDEDEYDMQEVEFTEEFDFTKETFD